jgi:adenylate cyclase
MVQERPVRVERRLTAILAADVAGYSRLMHHDEEATHTKLTTLLAEAIRPAISEHGAASSRIPATGFWRSFQAPSERSVPLYNSRPA